MKLPTASWPPAPRSRNAVIVATLYAGTLTVMTALQLFSFEKFIPLIGSLSLPGGLAGGGTASLLVSLAVLALPFLLRLKLSPAMRWLSMTAGWVVAAAWLAITLWIVVKMPEITNIGLLGASVTLAPGWWAPCFAVGLCLLAAWASWGMWPGHLEPRRKK